jgi:hypothetical protein
MRYLVNLTCVVDLPDSFDINHIAESPLAKALCIGMHSLGVPLVPSPDHNGERRVSILDGSMAGVELAVCRCPGTADGGTP